MADSVHVEPKVDSRCHTSQDGWMLTQQPSDPLKEKDSTWKTAQRAFPSPPQPLITVSQEPPAPILGLPCPLQPQAH